MPKPHCEQVADFVDRWSDENADRYEFVLFDGRRIVVHECYLSRDLANRPEMVWVNHFLDGYPMTEFDPREVAMIMDLEQQCPVFLFEKFRE